MSVFGLEKQIPSVVLQLLKSDQQYYLTGSRYFGGVNDNSDWDFIAKNCNEVLTELVDMGFLEVDHSTYNDPTVAMVMRLGREGYRTTIDVQLVDKLETKLFIQNVLKNHWLENGMPNKKTDRNRDWHLVHAVIDALPWSNDYIHEYGKQKES